MIDHQRKDRRQTATAAAIRPPALMLDPPLPDPRQINEQLKADMRTTKPFSASLTLTMLMLSGHPLD
jgi:hypothetical protein